MKNYMKILKSGLAVSALAALFASCSETDYMKYDATHNGIYFTRDTLEYSFGVTPLDQRTKEYRIPLAVMGTVSGEARTFHYEVIADSTTAVEGVQYRMGEPVIPADSTHGYIPVILLRDGLEGDHINGFTRYKLGVRLLPGGGFEPTLNTKAHIRVLTFDNAVEQPEWLGADGQKVWSETYYGVWHPLKLIKMVEYFHAMEPVNPETYYAMVNAFGENLEHVPFGDFMPYTTTMKKHVYQPMYDYFSNPDNREEILEDYPDFPFDFPDPGTY